MQVLEMQLRILIRHQTALWSLFQQHKLAVKHTKVLYYLKEKATSSMQSTILMLSGQKK